MKEEHSSDPNREGQTSPQDPNLFNGTFEAKESRRKRQTIRIKIPRKPAAPARVPITITASVPTPAPAEPARAHDLPLRITAFVIVALLVLVSCHFFFEFIRLLPLQDFLPTILWPQVLHRVLGIALLVGFGLFETTRKKLSRRDRWGYCVLLALGVALFAVQWIVRF